MFASQIIKVSIARPYAQVYEFLADPMNFARWASMPGTDVEPLGGHDWLVEVPRGQVVIRFSPRNNYGVLDYQTFPEGEDSGPVTPVRLYPNDDGAELVLTWFQRAGVTEAQFKSDSEWVASDLERLKTLIESDLGERREDANPRADALVEAREVVLLVGRVDAVVGIGEADQQRIEAEDALEVAGHGDRAAGAAQRGIRVPHSSVSAARAL